MAHLEYFNMQDLHMLPTWLLLKLLPVQKFK